MAAVCRPQNPDLWRATRGSSSVRSCPETETCEPVFSAEADVASALDQSRLTRSSASSGVFGSALRVSHRGAPTFQTPNMTGLLAANEKPDVSKIEKRAPSVAEMCPRSRRRHPKRRGVPISAHEDGCGASLGSRSVTPRALLAAGLDLAGHRPRGPSRARVLDALTNRVLVDFAVMCAGAATTTV